MQINLEVRRMSGTSERLHMATESQPASLPYRPPLRAWAGRGSGTACRLCGGAIEAHQVEYELELEPAAAERIVLYMHLECYQRWAASRP